MNIFPNKTQQNRTIGGPKKIPNIKSHLPKKGIFAHDNLGLVSVCKFTFFLRIQFKNMEKREASKRIQQNFFPPWMSWLLAGGFVINCDNLGTYLKTHERVLYCDKTVVLSSYNIEGKITECWLVETEGIFPWFFFRTRAKLLIPDWPGAKYTRIWLAERKSAPFAFCRRLETPLVQHKDHFKVWLLTG